ncbi:hypothetical protein [Nocardioides jejuensis]|uniref:Uncharacterized protein n=1 Tax=Nocardioides jejuensis TaxID=2502782 RepID=A0A4R1BZ71_9ACTN|nr:hypothetical protein [Nocardioides jejuensis]TCJ23048.1 hypothetical protein EPD65_11845 [Nocardioides jejuensis]
MSAPPRVVRDPKPTGGLVSARAVELAADAIRRAGHVPTPGNIRMVLRADRDARRDGDDYQPKSEDDFAWWDRLVSALPHDLRRRRQVARHEFGARR